MSDPQALLLFGRFIAALRSAGDKGRTPSFQDWKAQVLLAEDYLVQFAQRLGPDFYRLVVDQPDGLVTNPVFSRSDN